MFSGPCRPTSTGGWSWRHLLSLTQKITYLKSSGNGQNQVKSTTKSENSRNFAKSAMSLQQGACLEARLHQNRAKRPSKRQRKKHSQKVANRYAKLAAQHLPKQAFRFKWLHIWHLAASAQKCAQWLPKAPWNYFEILSIRCQRPPKVYKKTWK